MRVFEIIEENRRQLECLYFFLIRLVVHFSLLVILFYFNLFNPCSFEWKTLPWNWKNLLICISLDSCPFVFLIIRGITIVICSLLLFLFILPQSTRKFGSGFTEILFKWPGQLVIVVVLQLSCCVWKKIVVFATPEDEKGSLIALIALTLQKRDREFHCNFNLCPS